jgi:hypothetical protein
MIFRSTHSTYLLAAYGVVVCNEIAVAIAAGVRVAAAGDDGSTHRRTAENSMIAAVPQ